MADNTKIGPIFRGANGGLSDDLFTGIKNSFYYSNDMEIREDAKSIFPKPIPAYDDNTAGVSLVPTVGNEAPVCVVYSSQQGGFIVCLQRDVYLYKNDGTTALLCSVGVDICDAELFNGYIYISTRTGLYYKKESLTTDTYRQNMAAATDDTDPDYGLCTQALTANGWHPLYASDVCLCVGDTNVLRKVMKETPTLLQDGFTIQTNYYIRFINELGGFVRVVATDTAYGSEVLFRDKISEAPSEIIPLDGYSIIGATIYNGYQYLLSNKGLGLLNGYQYYILKKADGDINTTTKNGMCVFDDKLYFVANAGVYIYGAKNKNYADVLNLWHKVQDGFKLGALCSSTKGLVVTRSGKYVSGGTDIPVRIGLGYGLAITGEIQTMCYFGTSMSEIKQSEYLRVGYHLGKQGDNSGDIHIYYRTEADATDDTPDNWQWHPIQPNDNGLNANWDMRSPFATTLKLNCRFQWIQFKFVLNNCQWTDGGVTYTKDTNLYSADLYYNNMLD